jgi:hypothetical protein
MTQRKRAVVGALVLGGALAIGAVTTYGPGAAPASDPVPRVNHTWRDPEIDPPPPPEPTDPPPPQGPGCPNCWRGD